MPAAATSAFPTSIDLFPIPGPTNFLGDSGFEHDLIHDAIQDAVRKLETKVGIDSSADTNSLDWRRQHHQHLGVLVDGSASLATVVATGVDINTGADNHFKVGQDSAAPRYNVLTMNGDLTDGGFMGFAGGETGDANLYFQVPSGGQVIHRVAGAQKAVLGSDGSFTGPTLRTQLPPGAGTASTHQFSFSAGGPGNYDGWMLLRDETVGAYRWMMDASGHVGLGLNNAFPNSQFGILVDNAGSVGQIIKGFASQTADFQQWQKSDGTVAARVRYDGFISAPGIWAAGANGIPALSSSPYLAANASNLTIGTNGSANVGLIVQGSPGQTADIQQWQNSSGTVMVAVNYLGDVVNSNNRNFITSGGRFQAGPGASSIAAAVVGVGVDGTSSLTAAWRAVAGQTGDLTQWQNSAGVSMVRVLADGTFQWGAGNGTLNTAGGATFNSIITVNNSPIVVSINGYFFAANMSTPGQTAMYVNVNADTNYRYRLLADGSMLWGSGIAASDVRFYRSASGTLTIDDTAGRSVTFSIVGNQLIQPTSPAWTAQIVRGAVSQSADLTQWQNSSAAVLAKVDSNGGIYTSNAAYVGGATYFNAALNVVPLSSAGVGEVVRGAVSQSGDLTQWQNSAGTVLAKVESSGYLTSNIGLVANTGVATRIAGTTLSVNNGNDQLGIIVRGATGQASDLQQWQSSTPAAVARVAPDGTIATKANLSVDNAGNYISFAASSYIGQATAGGFFTDTVAGDLAIRAAAAQSVRIGADSGAGASSIVVGNSGVVPNTVTINSGVTIKPNGASNVAATIKSAISQIGDLMQWQNSGGSPFVRLQAAGLLSDSGGLNYFDFPNGMLRVNVATSTNVPLTIQGATSQSANLTGWRNSTGTVLSAVNAGGTFVSRTSTGGIVLQDSQATPHYWRVTISNTGVLTTTDLGTTVPTT